MKRNTERGVALVITLIMLALVTFMAVVFLAISRRERAAVSVSGDMANARTMADIAVARAQSELVARMMSSSNLYDYDLLVSTNYYNPVGFQPGLLNPYNVNYFARRDGTRMTNAGTLDWVYNIANLQFDARVPVFYPPIQTGGTNEFRYYLDLNRNGQPEPTGLLRLQDSEASRPATNWYVGDPEWIGVLEHPDVPHSDTNQFIGRYAYIILPTGKSLDINFIHNAVKRLRNDLMFDGYFRNEGVGSWEINLAGFLRSLNTNIWGYSYNPSMASPSSGTAFDDARLMLRYRYGGDLRTLLPAQLLYGFAANPNNPFALSGIDYYSDGPTAVYTADSISQPWAGSYNTNGYYDVQEMFDPNKTWPSIPPHFLNNLTTNQNAYPYDRYTFYRMLAQMGVDSQVPSSNRLYFADFQQHYTNRLHLNYWNLVPNGQTNFLSWNSNTFTKMAFFTNAADRMLRSSLDVVRYTNNLNRLQTNFMLGATPVRDVFSCTNIQLIHRLAGVVNPNIQYYATNNEYSASVHRLLQVAANILDATTASNAYPTVYRPIFVRTETNLVIGGYVEETGTNFLHYPWLTMEQAVLPPAPAGRPVLLTNLNVFGVPLIIGAKKGYPSFNKFVVQTVADISRRLEVRKLTAFAKPSETNQMYQLAISNRFGIEGWNSYALDFNHRLELHVTNQMTFALHHIGEKAAFEFPPRIASWSMSNNLALTHWPGLSNSASFLISLDTNLASMVNSAYETRTGVLLPVTTNAFEKSFQVPNWVLRLTNRLQYVLIDRSTVPSRIIDFVNLDKLVTEVDLTRGLRNDTNAAGGGIFSDSAAGKNNGSAPLSPSDMWNPAHTVPANINTPTVGALDQIAVSTGHPFTGDAVWRDASGQVTDKESAIEAFKEFLAGTKTNLTWQVPFTPSRRLYQKSSWEANDPLVHYTVDDLTDPTQNPLNPAQNTTNLLVRPIDFNYPIAQDAMLGQMNTRYRPWGGKPGKDPSNDPTAYNLTLKDPLVRGSDDWQFPTNKFPNLGTLGRVHRGTPWQTVFLKAPIDPRTRQALDTNTWVTWSGSFGTHPTNDWRLLDLFTAAPNDNASRGLLAVNQTNMAAWSAVLSGVTVLTNAIADGALGAKSIPRFNQIYIDPGSPQMLSLVGGITRTHALWTNHTFRTLGEVLATPELTVLSPYLNLTAKQIQSGIDDATYERIPQQVLSLLRTDEPRVTVYAFGQSLKPADRSLVTVANANPPIFNLCTNYQVTGEFATKTVLRLESLPPQPISSSVRAPVAQKMRAVVESYTVLQPD